METHARRSEGDPLLRWGMVAGPFYLAVGLVQALTRDGFDLGRHALSVLANGPGAWVQTANFVLSGLMVVAAAVGLERTLRPHSRASGWILGWFGVSMLVAAVFPADPVDGFPPGTPGIEEAPRPSAYISEASTSWVDRACRRSKTASVHRTG